MVFVIVGESDLPGLLWESGVNSTDCVGLALLTGSKSDLPDLL